MAAQHEFWNSVRDALRLVREAFLIEATAFRLELIKARHRAALRLRNLPSVHAQLSRVLFIIGRSGLLVGIEEGLRAVYAPVEGRLPNPLAVLLKQLEEGYLEEGALTRHPSMRAA
jgi:hypothetical protein